MIFEDNHNEEEIIHNIINKVNESIDNDQPYPALNQTDFLIMMLKPEEKAKYELKELQKGIDTFLLNPLNNRILRLNQWVKSDQETAIEYYSRDIGNDERLFFQEELEKDLINLMKLIKQKMAEITKDKLGDDGLDTD
jgi:response regulator RpfG family c-di-GMP phosphodiesterase